MQTPTGNPERYATVDIIHTLSDARTETVNTVWVSEDEWRAASFVDYIEVTANGELVQDFLDVHTVKAVEGMRAILRKGGTYQA